MIFQPFIKLEVGSARARRELTVAGAGHRVSVEGDQFVARCGARFGVRDDGAVFQVASLFRDQRCEACEAAST